MTAEGTQNVNRQPMGRQQVLIVALIVAAAVIGVVLWLVLGHSSKAKHHGTRAIGIGPIAFSAKNLKAESKFINTKFYWAGPQQGVRYEFTRNNKGYLFVRYLPKGVPVGVRKAHYLIVVTYPFPGAYEALKKQAKSRGVPGPNGSIILQRPHYRRSVLMAFPGVDKQIEIFDPNPAIAIATAESGDVKPVR